MASASDSLAGSFSKKDPKFGIIDDNCDGFDLDICPDLLLAGLALAAAGAFVALFTAITMAGRRKKRSVVDEPVGWSNVLEDLYWHGIDLHLSVSVCMHFFLVINSITKENSGQRSNKSS